MGKTNAVGADIDQEVLIQQTAAKLCIRLPLNKCDFLNGIIYESNTELSNNISSLTLPGFQLCNFTISNAFCRNLAFQRESIQKQKMLIWEALPNRTAASV
nr:uncharacterized protein LOC123569121 [Macaca fascicularis]